MKNENETLHEEIEHIEQQRQAIVAEFQMNFTIAVKPYNDITKSFQLYQRATDMEIAKLKELVRNLQSQVVKAVNQDVAVPQDKNKKPS